MAYIGKSPTGTGVRSRYYYTATGGETSLSGADDNSNTLVFSDGNYVDVSLNGIALVAGTDYNTLTANTISGLSALSSGDIVEIVVYDIFTVADTVSAKDGGTFSGNVAMGGTLSVTGASTLTGAATATGGLNVGTIKEATGTTTAMTIDSSGRVGFPNLILVQAYMTTTMSTTGIMIWNNEVIDTANAYDPTTGQFTCPKAGYYEVSYNYAARGIYAGHRTNVRKNGVNQGIESTNANSSLIWSVFSAGLEINMAASTIVECDVNDLLDTHLTYLPGAGDIYGSTNAHNNLTIKFLG